MRDTHKIQVLPDNVANQIAAGEVVERPASVLKELMENALDAKAAQIDVQIVSGGKTLIRVADNGIGMGRDNALLSIERFATSKIRDVSELNGIATLGFRGEALAAISSVSRFRLCTRRAQDPAGTEIIMSAGKIQEVRDQGCAPGTTVDVRNLFFNVPARRKFLRSQQTELLHIRQVFMLYALSHPETALTLSVDGQQTVNLPGNSTLDQRLGDLYPTALCRALRPVNYESGIVRISGCAGLPTHTRPDKSEQYIFINGRPAGAAVLASALREAYRSMLPNNRHPIVFLFISIDPSMVDVNVHPTKKEVRFHNPAGVRSAVIEAVQHALSPGGGPGMPRGRPPAGFRKDHTAIPESGSQQDFSYPRRSFSAPESSVLLPEETRNADVKPGTPGRETERTRPWPWMKVLGQVCGLYIVMETEDGLVFMDPHAAHERVLYEKFMAEVLADRVRSHGLLLPETVDLTPKDAQLLRGNLEILKKMGFGIAEFGGDSFVVDALPACLSGVAPAGLLTDVTACLEDADGKTDMETLLEERIAQAACKAAVKSRKSLSQEETESLLAQLGQMEMPYTCPHGRPTLIHISREELDRKFGRI